MTTLKDAIRKMKSKDELNLEEMRSFIVSTIEDVVKAQMRDIEDEIESTVTLAIDDKIDSRLKAQLKGDKGDSPIAGVDYEIPTSGEDYILTEQDKSDIAQSIKVPVVEKVVEIQTTNNIVHETPIVKEVAIVEKAEIIADKLNTLDQAVNISVIKGLQNYLTNLQRAIRESKSSSGGGGMGNTQHESFSVSSATTTVTTNYKIAANGYALWVYYNGQLLVRGTHYTVGSDRKILTLTFTPQDSTSIDIIYIRS